MQIAPNGAVIRIDNTATVNTVCPQANPIVKGIVPIAACTVALGVYDIMQNSFSCFVSLVFIKDIATPSILNTKAPIISKTANIPEVTAYFKSTVAPTSTKRNTSAATHNLLYLFDNRSDNTEYFCFITIPKLIIAKSPEIGMIPSKRFCNSRSRNEKLSIIKILTESLI